MGELRLPGLATGIDTAKLINQLMLVEQRTLQKYQERQNVWTERQAALSDLQSKLDLLNTAVSDLSDAGDLRAFATASSDEDIATAEASSTAAEGSHSVEVNQLALTERWVHDAGLEYKEDLVGAGTFMYSYNYQEVTLDTTDETTLSDLVGLINNDANNPGVTATLLHYGDAYHLVLSGQEAGSDYQITINDSNTEVWQSTSPFTKSGENAASSAKLVDLDEFSGSLVGDEYVTIGGSLHDGTVVSQDFYITSNTTLDHIVNEINQLYAGTATAVLDNGEIRLTDHTSGVSQMQLSLSYNNGSGSTAFAIPAIAQSTEGGSQAASLAGFTAADFTESQSAQDSQIKVDGYPLGAGDWIERSSNTVTDVIQGVTLNLNDVGTVQVNLTRDIESVKSKLSSLVDAYNDVSAFISEQTGYNEQTEEAGLLIADSTVKSIAGLLRSPLIELAEGFVNGSDSFLLAADIGLELDANGLLSFDSEVFDEAVADDYLDTLAIIGAAKIGSSNSNTIRFYSASDSYTTAGTYDVEVTVTGGAITSANIKLQSESTWRAATVSGSVITGDSTFDSNGDPLYAENGLVLTVDLSADGAFTSTVRVKQGFAGAMADALEETLESTDGLLPIDQDQVSDQIQQLQDRIDIEQERLVRREERLVARFARLEKSLTLLQNQMAALGMG
jgi:flagellar capping protein FliD